MKMTLKLTTEIHNALADKPVKKFKDLASAKKRLNALLDKKDMELRAEHGDGCIQDFGTAFLFARDKIQRKVVNTQYKLPKNGTLTRNVWDTAEQLYSELNRVPLITEMVEAMPSAQLNTIRTQYSRWCITFGFTQKDRSNARKAAKA